MLLFKMKMESVDTEALQRNEIALSSKSINLLSQGSVVLSNIF